MGSGRNLKRKRSYRPGNQYTNKKAEAVTVNADSDKENETPQPSSSKDKITQPVDTTSEDTDYNIIINFNILKTLISNVVCASCGSPVTISNNESMRMGFSNQLELSCTSCTFNNIIDTSSLTKNTTGKQGRSPYDVNVRMVAAFREIGRGYEPLQNFSRVANLHGMTRTCYDAINDKLGDAYDSVAKKSMSKAAETVFDKSEKSTDGHGLCRVSLDGSWQRRGHASLNGVVTRSNAKPK